MTQLDHHCILSFHGRNWRIWRVRRHLIDVERPVGYGHCSTVETIDTRHVDWEAYAAAAVDMDYRPTKTS